MKRETITKAQAAALLRGKLLPYFGCATQLKDGRSVGHGPKRDEYVLNTPEPQPDTIKWSEVL